MKVAKAIFTISGVLVTLSLINSMADCKKRIRELERDENLYSEEEVRQTIKELSDSIDEIAKKIPDKKKPKYVPDFMK